MARRQQGRETVTPHVVRLPHPDRLEPTVGYCDRCPWTYVYGWGEHAEAETQAAEHVEQECASESLTTVTAAGDRTVMPGVSL